MSVGFWTYKENEYLLFLINVYKIKVGRLSPKRIDPLI
jgi:hypothetical protein